MDTVLELVKQFADGKFSDQTVTAAAVLAVFAIIGVLKNYVFSEGKINLLSPREHQLRERLNLINDCLSRPECDPIRDALLDEQQRIIFQILHGIDAKATLREDLIKLYHAAGSKTTWRDIRMALPHFRQSAGRLVRGYNVFRSFFLLSLFVFGFGALICAVALVSTLTSGVRVQDLISLLIPRLILLGEPMIHAPRSDSRVMAG